MASTRRRSSIRTILRAEEQPLDLELVQRTARRAAHRLSRNRHDREDIAQEALLRAWKVAQQGRDPRIVANAAKWGAIDGARKLWKRKGRKTVPLEHDPAAPASTEDLRQHLRHVAHEHRRLRRLLAKPPRPRQEPDQAALAQVVPLHQVVRTAQRQALLAAGLSVEKAARALCVGRATLFRYVKADPSLLAPP